MKLIETDIEDGYIHIICPSCMNSESHPEDEQRSHLQNFNICEWMPTQTEVSKIECNECQEQFYLIWKD
jgi:hypothetical protein